ncbi:MAG: hypothetical protein WBC89_09005 [Dehalococcoidia bacterium]
MWTLSLDGDVTVEGIKSDVEYDDGHENDKFEWEVMLHGPIAGLRIVF